MAKVRAFYIGTIPEDQKFKGQAALIVEKMSKEAEGAKTAAQLASEIKENLITRQDPERVVAFYLSVWKKKGYVRVVEQDQPDAPVPEPKTDAVKPAGDGKFPDLGGKKLSEAVMAVCEWKAKALTAHEITELLAANGYSFKLNQVNSAVSNLVRGEQLVKVNGGDKVAVAA